MSALPLAARELQLMERPDELMAALADQPELERRMTRKIVSALLDPLSASEAPYPQAYVWRTFQAKEAILEAAQAVARAESEERVREEYERRSRAFGQADGEPSRLALFCYGLILGVIYIIASCSDFQDAERELAPASAPTVAATK